MVLFVFKMIRIPVDTFHTGRKDNQSLRFSKTNVLCPKVLCMRTVLPSPGRGPREGGGAARHLRSSCAGVRIVGGSVSDPVSAGAEERVAAMGPQPEVDDCAMCRGKCLQQRNPHCGPRGIECTDPVPVVRIRDRVWGGQNCLFLFVADDQYFGVFPEFALVFDGESRDFSFFVRDELERAGRVRADQLDL